MEKLQNLNDLLFELTMMLHDTEKQLCENLPYFYDLASSPSLRKTVQKHYEETVHQLRRVERAFHFFEKTSPQKDLAIAEMMKSTFRLIGRSNSPEVIDAIILSGMKQISTYKIAAYEIAEEVAKAHGHENLREYLVNCLEEERLIATRLASFENEVLHS